MRYISTRGEASAVGFTDAVLGGLAPDGGLYVPQTWPTFSRDKIASFAGMSYAQVAAEVLGAFAGDEIATDDLRAMCEEAYATFSHKAVVPLVQIGPQTFIAELFHGPSLAFKDVAMQILARLYDHFLGRQGRRQTILCATSGDTGGAAVEAFRGAKNVRVGIVLRGDELDFILRSLQRNEYLRESARAAELVQENIARVHTGDDRGVKQSNQLAVLNTARRPAILVEMGYSTNAQDAKILTGRKSQQALATAIADAIVAYLLEYERKTTTTGSGGGR